MVKWMSRIEVNMGDGWEEWNDFRSSDTHRVVTRANVLREEFGKPNAGNRGTAWQFRVVTEAVEDQPMTLRDMANALQGKASPLDE
jgi:hypothetical protein